MIMKIGIKSNLSTAKNTIFLLLKRGKSSAAYLPAKSEIPNVVVIVITSHVICESELLKKPRFVDWATPGYITKVVINQSDICRAQSHILS